VDRTDFRCRGSRSPLRRPVAVATALLPILAACLLLAAPASAASDLTFTIGPAISGTPTVGKTLSVTPANWTPAPTTITDSWSDGALGTSDLLPASDAGKTITVTETATDATGTATATASVGPITEAPANTGLPQILGTPVVGAKLTVSDGTWTGYPAPTFTYKWSDGTTGATKTVKAADIGQTLTVTVTGKNSVASASATSPAVGPVPAPPVNNGLPTISGTAQEGDTLVASPGAWLNTPTGYTYLWSDGTTGPTDKLSSADVGHSVTVTVTASNNGGSASATSAGFGPVAPASPNAVGTSTTLQAIPASALTNESVLLIATVTSSDGAHPPSGSVTFKNGGAGISGCTNVPVAPSGQSVTVNCKTSFGAQNANLTAVFTPSAGSILTASASPADSYAVGKDSTTTSLDVTPKVNIGSSTTYTASVDPPSSGSAPILPGGSVEFLDNGQPIPSCAAQPVSNGGATCTVAYRKAGHHSITADYSGDINFTGSLASPESVSVMANAPRTITPTMQWTFFYSPTYTRVMALVINGANGDKVLVLCHGAGCPFSKASARVKNQPSCTATANGACPARGKLNLTSAFHARRLRIGAQIRILITRAGFVGKYYSFTVRPRTGPRIRIACLAPGRAKPGAGCSG
jgi:Bacterial Ig-like domain (group 3)